MRTGGSGPTIQKQEDTVCLELYSFAKFNLTFNLNYRKEKDRREPVFSNEKLMSDKLFTCKK